MDLTLLLSAFLIGLLGSSHCFAMCSGISAAIGVDSIKNNNGQLSSILAYNMGRLLSYAIAGLILGSLSFVIGQKFEPALNALRLFSGLIMILMGLYICRWSLLLAQLERLSLPLWKKIQPYAQASLGKQGLHWRLICGMLWGWLPCGLVYSSLIWATSSASPINAALLMFCFGAGTLPSMILSSSLSAKLSILLKNTLFKALSGGMLIIYGCHTIYIGLLKHL